MFTIVLTVLFAPHFVQQATLGYGAIGVLAIYSAAAWLCSETLREKRPRGVLLDAHEELLHSSQGQKHYISWMFIPVLSITVVAT